MPGLPARIVAGDVYLIAQGTGPSSVNDSLLTNLRAQPWAALVSPEILAPGTIRGEAVLVRGADPATFVRMEGGTWVRNATFVDRRVFAGDGIATRLGLVPGSSVTLVGSAQPRIAFARIAGIFRTQTTANDEVVVDFPTARSFTGLGPAFYHSIRVRTADAAALVAFLRTTAASVHVSGPGLPGTDIRSDPPADARITNLLLRSGLAGLPRDYLSAAIGEAASSVSAVVLGIEALLAVLVAFGIHAVQARAFADRRPAVGVLRAVGAGNGWMRWRILRETIPLALVTGVIGAGAGFLLDAYLNPTGGLFLFGHAVTATLDLGTFFAVAASVVLVSSVSVLVLLQSALRVRPTEAIREQTAVEPAISLEAVLRG